VKTSGSIAEQQAPLPVNPSFFKQKSVGVEDVFFQHFFQERARRDNLKEVVRHKGAVNEEDRYKEKRRNEDHAFDTAEGYDENHTKIFEEGWETGLEEEDFVDQLAENLWRSMPQLLAGKLLILTMKIQIWRDGMISMMMTLILRTILKMRMQLKAVNGVELVGDDVEDDDDDDENARPSHISEMFTDNNDNEDDDNKEFEEDSSDEERDIVTNPADED
jgi:hypothetical protein